MATFISRKLLEEFRDDIKNYITNSDMLLTLFRAMVSNNIYKKNETHYQFTIYHMEMELFRYWLTDRSIQGSNALELFKSLLFNWDTVSHRDKRSACFYFELGEIEYSIPCIDITCSSQYIKIVFDELIEHHLASIAETLMVKKQRIIQLKHQTLYPNPKDGPSAQNSVEPHFIQKFPAIEGNFEKINEQCIKNLKTLFSDSDLPNVLTYLGQVQIRNDNSLVPVRLKKNQVNSIPLGGVNTLSATGFFSTFRLKSPQKRSFDNLNTDAGNQELPSENEELQKKLQRLEKSYEQLKRENELLTKVNKNYSSALSRLDWSFFYIVNPFLHRPEQSAYVPFSPSPK